MRHFLLLLLLTCLWGHTAPAQVYFNERYQNPRQGKQLGFTTAIPTDSGYLASGAYYDYPTNGEGGIVLRFLTPTGQVVRSRYYPNLIGGQANSLHRLPDGGYISLAQWVRATPTPLTGYTELMRFNALGDTLWTRRYLHGRTDAPITMCVLPDGGFAVAGYTGAPTVGQLDMLLSRFDANGNRLWWHQYPSRTSNIGWTLTPTADGGFLLGGGNFDLAQTNNYVLKTDSLGREEWHQELGSPTLDDGGVTVGTQLSDGTYLIAATIGKRVVNTFTRARHILYWISPQGQLLRQREFGPDREVAQPLALHRLPDGSIIVAGQQGDSTAQQMPEGFVYKLCPNGDSLWFRTYKILHGPDSHNYLRDLHPTPDGGFVGAGFLFTFPPDTGASDAWVFKIDSAGYLQAGGAPVTVQCRQPTGTAPESGAPAIDLYPNPAPDGRYHLRTAQPATAILSDALGRTIWRGRVAGSEQEIDLSHHPSGLYLLRVQAANGRTITHKLVR